MRTLTKMAAAALIGLAALGGGAASADDNDRNHRERDYRDDDHDDHQYDDRRYDDRRSDRRRYDDRRYATVRPDRCDIDHDHRYHHRDYYNYYAKDRYYRADPSFTISLNFGDRGGRYYDRSDYDRRGYRDSGRVVNREVYRIRGYDADAVLVEEVFGGRRGANLVCTVTARGRDARYVPYGQLRSIAARNCSRRADIRIYA